MKLPDIDRDSARVISAVLDGRVITDPDGRQWIFDPKCLHLEAITFGDNYCGKCGLRVRMS